MLRYTLMRLGIFVGCFLVVWGLVATGIAPRGLGGSNMLWVALLALVISAPISFVVLRKERDRASERIVARVDRAKAGLEHSRNQEDEADDADRADRADRKPRDSRESREQKVVRPSPSEQAG